MACHRDGDDAIASAALPFVSAAARTDARVDGRGLLLYACSSSQLIGSLVAALRAEQGAPPQRRAPAILDVSGNRNVRPDTALTPCE